MNYYFVPMLIEEFNNLFRLGSIRLPNGRWVNGKPQNLPISENDNFTDRLLDAMPSFEDTISIIVVQFSGYEPIKGFGSTCGEFYFENATASYALTSHDRSVLASRLGSGSKLATLPILVEPVVRALNKRLIEQSARDGAWALLTIYAKADEDIDGHMDELDRGVFNAVQARQDGLSSPIDKGSFLENLFCYSRTGPIPNFDLGFAQDAGYVLRHYCKSNGIGIEPFGLKEFLSEWEGRMRSATITEILNDLIRKGVSKDFDKHAALTGCLISTVVFLKLCREIREQGEPLTRERLHELLSGIEDQPSVARGIGWCGAFWGFSQFAAEYYACVPAGSSRPRFRIWPIGKAAAVDKADGTRSTVIYQPSEILDDSGEEERSKSHSLEAKSINEMPQNEQVAAQSEQHKSNFITQTVRSCAAEAVPPTQDPTNPVSEVEGNAIATEPVSNVEVSMHDCGTRQEENTLSSSTAPEPDMFALETQKDKERSKKSSRDKSGNAEKRKTTRRSGRSKKPKNAETAKSEPAQDVAMDDGESIKTIV